MFRQLLAIIILGTLLALACAMPFALYAGLWSP